MFTQKARLEWFRVVADRAAKRGGLSKVWKGNSQSFELAGDDKSMCRKRRTRMEGESVTVAKGNWRGAQERKSKKRPTREQAD